MTKHFTPSKKTTYLELFHQSGLTQTAFCKQQGLVFKTFNKWLKEAVLTRVAPPNVINHFQNGVETNTTQAAFIPIHLNDALFCEPSPYQPPEPDCSVTSPSAFSKNVPHESVLGFKTNQFSLDIALDLSTDYGQSVLKLVTQALHQLSGGQDSYD